MPTLTNRYFDGCFATSNAFVHFDDIYSYTHDIEDFQR